MQQSRWNGRARWERSSRWNGQARRVVASRKHVERASSREQVNGAAGSARLDLDGDFVNLGHDRNRRRRRVYPAMLLRRRHALHAVHPRLKLEFRVDRIPLDLRKCQPGLDACERARLAQRPWEAVQGAPTRSLPSLKPTAVAPRSSRHASRPHPTRTVRSPEWPSPGRLRTSCTASPGRSPRSPPRRRLSPPGSRACSSSRRLGRSAAAAA